MGYNSRCSVQNCTQNCCNSNGVCPYGGTYSSSTTNKCKYYYTQTEPMDSGAVAGIAVGALVGFTLFIIILTCCIIRCCQKRQQHQQVPAQQNQQINVTNQQLTTEYTDPNQIVLQKQQPFVQPYVQPYGQPYGQPYIQQQGFYGSPEQALFGGQPVYQQPPVYPGFQANTTAGLYGPNPIVG